MAKHSGKHDIRMVKKLVRDLLIPERNFFQIAIIYGLAISLFSLAVPVAVQTLINTVVNTASISAVVSLAILLFATLGLSGFFSALRFYIMEKYERHIYARLTAEISIRTLMTQHSFFAGHRNTDITNRFFDIITFQRNVPPLVVDGFALFLQTIVGFTLVSFYHPIFFLLCVLIIFILLLIWKVWSYSAISTAVDMSHAKYATAKWLGDIAEAHSFFKTGHHIEYARQRSDDVTADYVYAHRQHFKHTFAQKIALLTLYALASSSLLGVGGILVVNEELSIGQLVASELVLTAIFFGLSKAVSLLKRYYQLCGAADELGMVFDMPLNQDLAVNLCDFPESGQLTFHDVYFEAQEETFHLDFELASGSKMAVFTTSPWIQRALINMLKRHEKPPRGWVQLADHDISEYKNQHLSQQPIWVISKALIIECSIVEYMRMCAPEATLANIQKAIELVGLKPSIMRLENGIDTPLSAIGSPLQPHEFLLLKVAAAIVSKPRVLVLTQYFDNLPKADLLGLLKALEHQPFTLLYFTNMPELEALDGCLCLDWLKEGQNAPV